MALVVEKNRKNTEPYETVLELLRNQHEANEKLSFDITHAESIDIACHEMKTSIQSIISYSELLYKEPEKNREKYITAIFRNAMRLQRLSNNMLDATRIHTLKLRKERFDINELISSVIDDIKNQIEISRYKLQDIKLKFEPDGSVLVKADKDRIAQVMSNLIGNAFKFTKKGEIEITAKEKKDEVVVTVKDTGSGIDPKILPKLFMKFVTTSPIGTGLGLYISKNIIEAHGGKIWATNNFDRIGSSFTFTLPIISKKYNRLLR